MYRHPLQSQDLPEEHTPKVGGLGSQTKREKNHQAPAKGGHPNLLDESCEGMGFTCKLKKMKQDCLKASRNTPPQLTPNSGTILNGVLDSSRNS